MTAPAPALHPSERSAPRVARVTWLLILVLPALAFAALSAQGALRLFAPATLAATIAVPPPRLAAIDPPSPAPIADAAALPPGIASPAAGTTGTAELPPVPAGFVMPGASTAGTITPARPFSIAGIGATDRARALECLTAAVYYEAASEPDDGQRAVAQVVLNRVRHPAFPGTVCGVVYQGSERAGCQFSFACDGAMARTPIRSGWSRAARNAAIELGGYVFAPVGLATHYHTYAVTPAWNRTLVMTDAIGAHFFHRWKGFWGTAAAFSQRYAGAEPFPGPHARLTPPGLVAPDPVVLAGPTVRAITPPADVQPAHATSGQPIAVPESQILDRWKDSGQPLR